MMAQTSVDSCFDNLAGKSVTEGIENSPQQLPIETITVLLKQKLNSAIQNIIEAGELLIEAKRLLGHGKFSQWLREHFNMSPKSANRFMSVAHMVRQRQLQSAAVEQIISLDLKSLYELSARSTSETVQEQVFEDIKAGKLISYHYIKSLKKQYKNKNISKNEIDNNIINLLPDLSIFSQDMEKYVQLAPEQAPMIERFPREELLFYADQLQHACHVLEQLAGIGEQAPGRPQAARQDTERFHGPDMLE